VTPRARSSPRRTFGQTWWGRAWIDALEQRARLDPNRLPRGRTYARTGRVGALNVSSGAVRAAVQGSRVTPYIVQVRVRQFDDDEWERVLDAVSAKAAHTAALLDGELPPGVVEDAASVGVGLLPDAGELGVQCSCPDWASPCKHAAAVVYLVADVLDTDPFALLLLRGRSRDEVLSDLRRRRAQQRSGPAAAALTDRSGDAGVAARDTWAASSGREVGDPGARLPGVPLPPRRPGEPVPLAVDPPAASGVRRQDLASLAADAAQRAWELSLGEGDGGLGLDQSLDVVRRAAAFSDAPGRRGLDELVSRSGMRAADLLRRASAWRMGGADAVAVLDTRWSPTTDVMEEGRVALAASTIRFNRVTAGSSQLRVTQRGSWYRFTRTTDGWELVDGPAADPSTLT